MWLLKIVLKIIFSRLPISRDIWKRIGVFRNGGMNEVEYSKKIFFGHMEQLKSYRDLKNPTIMEIGPGDGLATSIYSRIYNSSKVYLIDIEAYADKDISVYKKIISSINGEYLKNTDLEKIKCINDLLVEFNTEYLIEGINSMKKLNSDSVDYLFSHSVMEHLRLSELEEYIKEMKRVLKPNGLISHNINYKDHLDESLNNLRFPEKVWESDFFSNSGFYTNRIPAFEMHNKFAKNGFKILWENFGYWEKLPIKRKYLNKKFAKYSSEELINCTSAFIAGKEI